MDLNQLSNLEQQLKQKQKLVMTPKLQQAIEMLQFSTQELKEYLNDQLLENPLLELERECSESYSNYSNYNVGSREGIDYEAFVSEKITWRESLLQQLCLILTTKEEKKIAEYIVGNLTDQGFLVEEVEEISNNLAVKKTEVKEVLKEVKHSLYPGAAASNWQESLAIQLEELESIYKQEDIRLAKKIVKDYPTEFQKNQLKKIARGIGIKENKVQQLVDIITSLNPVPIPEEESLSDNKYLQPDIIIKEKSDESYIIIMNDNSFPTLRLRPEYRKLLARLDDPSQVEDYIEDKLKSALWLIKSIEQRRQTIYNIVKEIIKYQKDFFNQGIEFLRPMTMEQIAERIEMHKSTVSRATDKKYVQTPYGLFSLKFFFNPGIKTKTGEVSVVKIKYKLKQIIKNEDKNNPFSDKQIANKLKEAGIKVARRTVAKYRKELNIPSSRKRKRY